LSEKPGSIEPDTPERRRRGRPARVVVSRSLPPKRSSNSAPPALRGRHQPLQVTASALEALSAVRAKQHGRANQAIGIALDADGGLELVLDEPGERDRGFVWNDELILFVTATADDRLAGYVLDHVRSSDGVRFKLEPIAAE
jgi:hypothetical protein